MTKPVLSIIIVSYNTKDLTTNCIKSIATDKGLLDIPHEIIIVDNASSDGSQAALEKIKTIKLIKNKQNLGFGTANNQGLKISQGNYILLLNSDTLILKSAISQCLTWLSAHGQAGIVTGQLLNPDQTIQISGGFFPTLSNIFTWSTNLDDLPLVNKIIPPFHPHTPDFYTKDKFFTQDHQQDWVTGAFMLIRKSLIDAVAGFDPNYFMYGEEVELCYRIKKLFPDYQTWYLTTPKIIHIGGASSTNKSHPIIKEYQGVLSFFKKHRPHQYFLVKILLKVNACLRGLIRPKTYLPICSKI